MRLLRRRAPKPDHFLAFIEGKDFGEDDAIKKAILIYIHEGATEDEALAMVNRDIALLRARVAGTYRKPDRSLGKWVRT